MKKGPASEEAGPFPFSQQSRPGLFLDEVQPSEQSEHGIQEAHGPGHVTEEAGHLDALLFGDSLHHEVGGVADVGNGAHEHGTGGDSGPLS